MEDGMDSNNSSDWWVSPALGVAEVAGKGRGIVALKALKRGELIATERPLAASLRHQPGQCDVCGFGMAPQEVYKACADCDERWCSERCAREAVAYHWAECGEEEDLMGRRGEMFRLCLRILLTTPAKERGCWARLPKVAYSGRPSLAEVVQSNVHRIRLSASLPNHKKDTRRMDIYPELKRRVEKMSRRLVYKLQLAPRQIRRRLFRVVFIAYTNTFNIYGVSETEGEGAMRTVGAGFFPAVSLLNHSCLPNTTRRFEGSRMLMRVIRDVEVGEELTTTYGTSVRSQNTQERQDYLRNWSFLCACEDACGDPKWRLCEAEFTGFACRYCSGAALPDAKAKVDWSLEGLYEQIPAAESFCSAKSLPASLPIRCFLCQAPDRLPARAVQEVLNALLVIRQRAECRSELTDWVRHLHPRNHHRLIAIWTVEFHRCLNFEDRVLDDTAVVAMRAIHENLCRLLRGTYDMEVAKDALEALQVLRSLPSTPQSLDFAAILRERALSCLDTHYGEGSPHTRRLAESLAAPL